MQSTYYCPGCRAPVAYGQDFCRNCGTALTWTSQQQLYYCPYCSSAVTYGQAACTVCGTALIWGNQQASQSYGGQQQAYGQQTGWNQSSPYNTGWQTTTQQEGQSDATTAPKSASSRKPGTFVALGVLLTLVLAGGALILGMNWNSITSSMGGNALKSPTPATAAEKLTILSFVASPATIAPGEKSTLSWNTAGTISVTIDHNIGKVAAAGSSVVSPSADTTYTLTASDRSGSITRSTPVNIVIPVPPVISSFTAAPTSVSPGQTSTLQWNVTGASYIIIDHGVGTVSASGSSAVTPSENTTYTLTAGGPAGTVTASAAVTVATGARPVVSIFSASPAAVSNGQPSILQWNVTGATSISINHDIGEVSPTGSISVSPSENTTYTLTATSKAGSATASAAVSVGASRPPVIASFTATPATISGNQTSTLQWNVTGATSVSINKGIGTVDVVGTITVSPSSTITYTLTASSGGAPVTATATVSILTAGTPSIASFTAVPGVITAGQSTELRWNVAGATSVSIDQGIGAVPITGTLQVSPATHTIYTLTATGTANSVTATVTVTVAQSSTVTISSFTSSPGTIHAGDQSTLQWNVSGATSVAIDHGVGPVSLQGTIQVTPTENTTYTLTAGNGSGGTSATLTVSVIAAGTPIITSFIASPATVTSGQSSTLEWNVTGANSVSISGGIGIVSLTGSATITPSENTTYTLTAQGNPGTASSTVNVTVNRAP
jgi:hypothetical protein